MRNCIITLIVIVATLVGCHNQSKRNDLKIYNGKVVTELGVPIPDVVVSVGETYATTDNDGNFSCFIPVHNQQYDAAFKHANFTDYFTALSNNYATIVLSEKKESDANDCVKVSIKAKSEDCSYNLKTEVIPSYLKVFNCITPGNSIINLPQGKKAMGCYPGLVKLTAERKDGHSQLKQFNAHTVELSFSIPENFKGEAPNAVHFWRFDESLHCWVMGPSATRQGDCYTAAVNETGWWCAYETPSKDSIRCIKAQLTDFYNDPIPYAELTVKDEGKDIGHLTSTKDGKVLFYFTNNTDNDPKVYCNGYHLPKPNENVYPFVAEDTLYTINKLIINDDPWHKQETYKVTINEINVTEAKKANNISIDEDIDPVKYASTYNAKQVRRNQWTTPLLLRDSNAIVAEVNNRVATITPEMLGLGLIKKHHGGEANFWDNAHAIIIRDSSSIIKSSCLKVWSNDYKEVTVTVFPNGRVPTFLSVDSTQYVDDKGNKKCRLNSFSILLPEGEDGFEFISIIYDGNRDKSYNLGKHSFGVRDTARFSIKYHSSFDYTRKVPLGSAKYKIVASKPIRLIATVNQGECQLKICKVTDAYGRNALSNARYDYIKPQALLTGKLDVEFFGRDSLYNQTVYFRKYKESDFDNNTSFIIWAIVIGGIIILLIIKTLLNNIATNKKNQNGQVSLIAHILQLNPVFSKKQIELIEKYIKDHGFSKKAIDDIKKKIDNKEKVEYEHFDHVNEMELNQRREFIHLLFKLSAEDDGIKNDEWNELYWIMGHLGMNRHNIEYMQRRYSPLRSEYDDYSKYYQSSNSQQSNSYSNTSDDYSAYASDYAELGLLPDATKEEVQQAYHKLAMELHPDLPKNAGRHDECVRRMAAINVAYRQLIKNL